MPGAQVEVVCAEHTDLVALAGQSVEVGQPGGPLPRVELADIGERSVSERQEIGHAVGRVHVAAVGIAIDPEAILPVEFGGLGAQIGERGFRRHSFEPHVGIEHQVHDRGARRMRRAVGLGRVSGRDR